MTEEKNNNYNLQKLSDKLENGSVGDSIIISYPQWIVDEVKKLELLAYTAAYGSLTGSVKGDTPYTTWGRLRTSMGCSPTGKPEPL